MIRIGIHNERLEIVYTVGEPLSVICGNHVMGADRAIKNREGTGGLFLSDEQSLKLLHTIKDVVNEVLREVDTNNKTS